MASSYIINVCFVIVCRRYRRRRRRHRHYSRRQRRRRSGQCNRDRFRKMLNAFRVSDSLQ